MMDDDGAKKIDAHRLANLLLTLPIGSQVNVNRVGNLSVTHPDRGNFAFVDFVLHGEIEYFARQLRDQPKEKDNG